MKKQLTKTEAKVLKNFLKFKKCPSLSELSEHVGLTDEGTRKVLWKLVAMKYLKVNKKLTSRKFYA